MRAVFPPFQKHRSERPAGVIERSLRSPGTGRIGASPQTADGALKQVATERQEGFVLVVDRLGTEVEPFQRFPPGRSIIPTQRFLGQFAQTVGLADQSGAQRPHPLITRQSGEAFGGGQGAEPVQFETGLVDLTRRLRQGRHLSLSLDDADPIHRHARYIGQEFSQMLAGGFTGIPQRGRCGDKPDLARAAAKGVQHPPQQ